MKFPLIAIALSSLVAAPLLAEPETGEARPDETRNEVRKTVRVGEDFFAVASGDTYERIARRKEVDVDALRAANRNTPLRAGLIIRIPIVKDPPEDERHEHREGDRERGERDNELARTLERIEQRLDRIEARLNRLEAPRPTRARSIPKPPSPR